jgi:16S rRNA processing protein RimM
LAIGQIAGAHGVRGELKVDVLTDDPQRFGLLERVLVGPDDGEPVPYGVEGYRMHQQRVLLKLAGVDTREQAATLRGQLVQVPIDEAMPLEEGEYYEHQIVGLDVWTAEGERLGTIAEILYVPSNDVYVVQDTSRARRECLIPALSGVVLAVDLEAGRMTVELPPGLIDED